MHICYTRINEVVLPTWLPIFVCATAKANKPQQLLDFNFGIPRSTLRRRRKCLFARRIEGQTTFSKDEPETMATVMKGFETMNLSLTRRKFLLFSSDVYVASLLFFHCSFFRTFFGSLSWFFVFRDDWLNVCTLPLIFLQKFMRFGWRVGEIWKGVQFKHAIHSGCPI